MSIDIGDKIEVYHTQTEERRGVEFDGIHVERPYVMWQMSGSYCVDMETGLLKKKPKSRISTMWRVAEADQAKLQEALDTEKERLRDRFRKNKKT